MDGLPSGAMCRDDYLGGQLGECFASGTNYRLEEGPAQMEPTYHCVDLIDARELPRVSADIDYARMPTAGQHHQPFAGNVEDQGLIIEDKWVGLP